MKIADIKLKINVNVLEVDSNCENQYFLISVSIDCILRY